MALLYQRYKKFDTATSYTQSNMTYFNIFGAETLRVGRYKVNRMKLNVFIFVCGTYYYVVFTFYLFMSRTVITPI
jgi:hypothetical protein